MLNLKDICKGRNLHAQQNQPDITSAERFFMCRIKRWDKIISGTEINGQSI